MTEQPLISVRNLSKRYVLGQSPSAPLSGGALRGFRRMLGLEKAAPENAAATKILWALKDVSFDIRKGERVGIIGRNGAGKSSLLKILSRVALPTEGEARIRGRVTSLLEVGTGFNLNLTGRENIYLNASLHGLSRQEITQELESIIEFSEIERFIDTPIKYYSTGMRARLAFAVAAHLNPDILLLDEVLAVGDIGFQRKCLGRMESMTDSGRTLMFVSHSMESVSRFCDRCIWLDRGRIAMDGTATAVTSAYARSTLDASTGATWTPVEKPLAAAGDAKPETQAPAEQPPSNAAGRGARLISARVLGPNGQPVDAISVHMPMALEITYEVLDSNIIILPSFRLYNQDELLVSTIACTSEKDIITQKACGIYRSTAKLQGNIFNTGLIEVSVGLNSLAGKELIKHHVVERALSFYVQEAPNHILTARGAYGEVKGVVRLFAAWESALEAAHDRKDSLTVE